MEKQLPSEILIQIFLSLPVNDIPSIYNTCSHWRNIIDDFNIWKSHWVRLVLVADNSNLNEDTRLALKQLKSTNVSLKKSCLRLNNILLNKTYDLHKCLTDDMYVRKLDFAILKTHHSHISLTGCTSNEQLNRNNDCYYAKNGNDALPNCKSYMLFRSLPKIIDNINKLFGDPRQNIEHVHIKLLLYIYPMGISEHLEEHFITYFFESCHVEEVILIPRVLMLCENLEVKDAIVVYSTSRTTEVAVVVDGFVMEGRWCELPIGGWKVAENLHAAFSWLHPNADADVKRFDDPNIKSMCWMKMCPMSDSKRDVVTNLKAKVDRTSSDESFVLKNEQYLAAEVMYAELELYTVIERLLEGLPEHITSNCLNHVLLTGGNCELKYMETRIRLDLMKAFPKFANMITPTVFNGRVLCYVPARGVLEMDTTKTFQIGKKSRLKRQDYIIGDIDV